MLPMRNEYLFIYLTAMDDSTDALESLRENSHGFDILITDMTMLKIAGVELAKQARGIRSDVPIILCSGYREIPAGKAIKAREIDRGMSKPVTSEDLVLTIRNLLAVKTGQPRQPP
jgi:two-component SAPR family response regulator